MSQLRAIWATIYVYQYEGRAGYCIGRSPAGSDALYERCLPAAQLTLQADYVSYFEQATQLHSQSASLFDTVAEYFAGTSTQDRHKKIISQRVINRG